jgi:hypothetical protein
MATVESFTLTPGRHRSATEGVCFNELASVLAGEPFSDKPRSVSPVVRRLGSELNDALDDQSRQLLRPFIPRAQGTADDGRDDERERARDRWKVHKALPGLLELAGCADAARRLRELPAELEPEMARRGMRDGRDAAWAARRRAGDRLRGLIEHGLAGGGQHAAEQAAAKGIVNGVVDSELNTLASVVAGEEVGADVIETLIIEDVAESVAIAVADAAASEPPTRFSMSVFERVRELVTPAAATAMACANAELQPGMLELLDEMLPAPVDRRSPSQTG